MTTTYYSYVFVQSEDGNQAIITSSETALPKPKVEDQVSVSSSGRTVAGTISKVTVDIVQNPAGGRSITYQVMVGR